MSKCAECGDTGKRPIYSYNDNEVVGYDVCRCKPDADRPHDEGKDVIDQLRRFVEWAEKGGDGPRFPPGTLLALADARAILDKLASLEARLDAEKRANETLHGEASRLLDQNASLEAVLRQRSQEVDAITRLIQQERLAVAKNGVVTLYTHLKNNSFSTRVQTFATMGEALAAARENDSARAALSSAGLPENANG